MRKRLLWALLALLAAVEGRRRITTEEEQAKFLQELKQRELRNFETEMKQQSEMKGTKYSSSQLGVQLESGTFETEDLPVELRDPAVPKKKHRHHHHHHNEAPAQAQALRAPADTKTSLQNLDISDEVDEEHNWCYFCASPIDKLRPEMKKSIRNLLEMRRTAFPIDAVTPECLTAKNLTKLKKQKCSYKYCQTLSILDRNAGNSFVVRGCAEHFGAINVPELEKKNDHSCEMLHEKLEIKECICKTKKYCDAGWRKRSANGAYRQSFLVFTLILSVLVFSN